MNDPTDWRAGRARFTQRLQSASAGAAWDRRSAAGRGRCSGQEQGAARSAASVACPAVLAVSGLDRGYAWPVRSKMYAEVPGRLGSHAHPRQRTTRAVHTSEAWMCMRSIPEAQLELSARRCAALAIARTSVHGRSLGHKLNCPMRTPVRTCSTVASIESVSSRRRASQAACFRQWQQPSHSGRCYSLFARCGGRGEELPRESANRFGEAVGRDLSVGLPPPGLIGV